MGCQMATTRHETQRDCDTRTGIIEDESEDDLKTPNLLSLPDEVLVKIISFLPGIRDRVKLRYVSRKLRSISTESPSLWREFVWFVNPRAEQCLHNVMKACGAHIKRLSFHHLIQTNVLPTSSQKARIKLVKMSEMVKMLQYCNNVTHLNLPALDHWSSHSDAQLRERIQQMKHLEVLTVHCRAGSFQPYLNLKTTLKELTICTVIQSKEDIHTFKDWKMNEFTPPNLNIIVLTGSMCSTLAKFKEYLVTTWSVWNSQISAGHVACFRLYISYKVPLNLFQNAPNFQLQYGEMATPLFVQVHNMENMEIHGCLLLTNCCDDDKMVHKAKFCQETLFAAYNHKHDNRLQTDNVTNLTELDLSDCDVDIKPIILACPQLQRLSLSGHRKLRLDDLQMIATCCCNLQGLNLIDIAKHADLFYVKAWEILSSMKLTHLSMDSLLYSSQIDDPLAKQFISLFKQCTKLQALELYYGLHYTDPFAASNIYELLSHFPSLEYCRVNTVQLYARHGQFNCTQGILTTCEKLKYFYCSCSVKLSLSTAYYNNLQQLYILSEQTDLDDNFMDTVSAHGGLIHVAFLVSSMTSKGIITLIKNSPNLLTLVGLLTEKRYKDKYFESLSTSLAKTFAHRNLFTSGFCLIQQFKSEVNCIDPDDLIQNTDLLSLWPSIPPIQMLVCGLRSTTLKR